MQRAMQMHEPLSDGRDAAEASVQRAQSARAKRERDAEDVTLEIATRRELLKASVGSLPAAHGGPLVAVEQARSRDRDLGVRSAAANGAATRHAPIRVRSAHAVARAPDQQLEAARSARPLEPLIRGSGYDGMENLEGNRFGGDEICQSCAQPHVDSNYVATDAHGVTYCGDCWDAALGVTIIAECALALGTDQCACGKELRTERWFAVECTPAQEAFCQACCLNFWGFTAADMIVSAVKDSRITRLERQERGAHLHPSWSTPNDDTSPLAGLSDRGFSPGQVPSTLGGCMNLSPGPGEQMLPVLRAHDRHARTHTHAYTHCLMLRTARPESGTKMGGARPRTHASRRVSRAQREPHTARGALEMRTQRADARIAPREPHTKRGALAIAHPREPTRAESTARAAYRMKGARDSAPTRADTCREHCGSRTAHRMTGAHIAHLSEPMRAMSTARAAH